MIAADVIARAPLLPGADVAAYREPREYDVFARAPLIPGADVAAYPLPLSAPSSVAGASQEVKPASFLVTVLFGTVSVANAPTGGNWRWLQIGASAKRRRYNQ